MEYLKFNILLMLGCMLVSLSSYAEIEFNGFMTVGGGQMIDDDEISEYAGFDGKWKSDPDTVFGLQVSSPLGEKLKATAQFIARGEDGYDIEAEWAYLTYSVNDSLDLRAGRLRSPLFGYSDYLDVGFAYPFIRPPTEVYRILFTTVTGVDANYSTSFGAWDATFQGFYGRMEASVNLAGEEVPFDLPDFMGVNMTLTYDWLSFRASYNNAPDATIPAPAALQPLLDGITAAGFPSVADALDINGEKATFWGMGVNIDYEGWLAAGEYTEILFDDQSLLSDDDAWYLMLGKRMGNFTLHVTYQEKNQKPDMEFLEEIPAGVAPALDGLRAVISGAVRQSKNKVTTFGVRYEVTPSAALKVEYAHINFDNLDQTGGLLSFSV
ncbi:MAG: porin, partial [Pseudomonadales bacterium]|nr:porin [Pseudomonadales bacterium]